MLPFSHQRVLWGNVLCPRFKGRWTKSTLQGNLQSFQEVSSIMALKPDRLLIPHNTPQRGAQDTNLSPEKKLEKKQASVNSKLTHQEQRKKPKCPKERHVREEEEEDQTGGTPWLTCKRGEEQADERETRDRDDGGDNRQLLQQQQQPRRGNRSWRARHYGKEKESNNKMQQCCCCCKMGQWSSGDNTRKRTPLITSSKDHH